MPAKASPAYEYRLVLDGPRGRYIWTGFPSELAIKLDEVPVPMDYVWNGLKSWLRERVMDSNPERVEEVLSWLGDLETSVMVDEVHYGIFRRSLPLRLTARITAGSPADGLGPLPRVHERERATVEAQRELNEFLEAWRVRHGLTSAETSLCVSNALRAFASRLVAIERRPPPPEPK